MIANFKSLLTKRFYSTKPWSYQEATAWQKAFKQQDIPKEHISLSFNRSSGPGGQNVNKVNTKVDLRLSLTKANWIPDYAKEKLKKSTHVRKSKSDELIITSGRTRSQAQNIQDCYSKLTQIIIDSVSVTKEPSQSTLSRVENLRNIEDKHRKEYKKKHSQKKSNRRSKGLDY